MINFKDTFASILSLIVIYFFIPGFVNCQSSAKVLPNIFNESLSLEKGSVLFNSHSSYRLNRKEKISFYSQKGDTMFVKFESDIDKNTENDSTYSLIPKKEEKFYVLTTAGSGTKIKFRDWDIQPFTVPIKIRPSLENYPFQFVGDVSVGPYLGYQMGSRTYSYMNYSDLSLTFASFATPTLINLNPSNSDKVDDSNQAVLGLTSGLGILFDINDYQFGLVSGFDWVSGDASKSWIYQGKQWISISFGFELDKK